MAERWSRRQCQASQGLFSMFDWVVWTIPVSPNSLLPTRQSTGFCLESPTANKIYYKYTHTQRSHTQTGYLFLLFFILELPTLTVAVNLSQLFIWIEQQARKFLLFSAKLHLSSPFYLLSSQNVIRCHEATLWPTIHTHTHNSSCCTSSRDVVIVCYLRRINKMFLTI